MGFNFVSPLYRLMFQNVLDVAFTNLWILALNSLH